MNQVRVVRRAFRKSIDSVPGRMAEGSMIRRLLFRYRSAVWAIAFLLGLLLSVLLTVPAVAHLTQVDGDIAGTWHVEPDHSPRAGEPAQVWVALTQRGGQIVPLDQCDCQLAVYQGSAAIGTPILKPSLQAVAAETFKGIPGTEIVFPQVGQYQLKLTGRPTAAASFQPFELVYSVTVATGNPPAAQPAAPQAQTPDSSSPIAEAETRADSGSVFPQALIGLGAIVLVAGAIGVALRQRQAKRL